MMKCPKLNQEQIKELKEVIKNKQSSAKEVRRAQTILLIDKETDCQIITGLTGYKRKQIFNLRKNYLKDGIETIKDKRKKQPKELLTKKQRQEVIEILKNKKPKDYNYDSDYWTTGILGYLLERWYNVKYKSKTSYYLIFREAKFTYHKPGRQYHQKDEKEVERWKRSIKPILNKVWKDKNTVILTEDEMNLSTQTTVQKVWLPQGEYPKIEISNKKENRSIYGFLDIKTGKEHAFKAEWQNMFITCDVLKKLRKVYPTEKLLIFWDGAGWHRGSEVQKFIKEDGNIEIIYFPKYAPELNPQEYVWKNGRNKITHNKFIQNIDMITDEFINYLNNTKFNYSLLGYSVKM